MYFNVFEAAPENDRDGPSQQAAQNAGGKVRGFGVQARVKAHLFLAVTRIFSLGQRAHGRLRNTNINTVPFTRH